MEKKKKRREGQEVWGQQSVSMCETWVDVLNQEKIPNSKATPSNEECHLAVAPSKVYDLWIICFNYCFC